MKAEPSPIVSGLQTEEQAASHDRWFRAKVQASIDDPRPNVPHDRVMADMRALIARRSEKTKDDSMMDLKKNLIGCLIFPIAPVAVIYLTFALCSDIWAENFYTPGEDGGEVEPMLALLIIPLLLVIVASLLAGLTGLSRWITRRFEPRAWWRWLLAIPRLVLAAVALFLFLLSSGFLMGDTLGPFRHWQVACAWAACAATVSAFLVQQFSRLKE